VLDTLTCALWALHESGTFEEGLLMAVNLGGDADTVGAVYGQVAGAVYGLNTIPQRWLDGLCDEELLARTAEEAYQFASVGNRAFTFMPRVRR
jgi:ADP-ribosyl-[dinitrogen reductase] hydrolase